MSEIRDTIQIDDHWYVLATSSRADDQTRVLKHDELFGLFDRWGDVQTVGLGDQGLYFEGTRFLSRCELTVNERRPLLLNSTVQEDNCLMVVDLTTPDLYADERLVIPKGTLHIFRSRLLWQGVLYEHLRIHNYGEAMAEIVLGLCFEADYRDIFEVRGIHRPERGRSLPEQRQENERVLRYRGLDDIVRRTRITMSRRPEWTDDGIARFPLSLAPGDRQTIDITVACEVADRHPDILGYEEALASHRALTAQRREGQASIYTSNEQFNDWINRSAADLQMLTTATAHGDYPYAGVPWFSTPFGRDGIITAMQMLWVDPGLARGVLAFLAAHQADRLDPDRDAEPGKIPHEIRKGEMAALGEVPFDNYYGSADATPLFVCLADAYYRRTGDREFCERLWPHIVRALEWIDAYGDRDGDGFVEYHRQCDNGLVQQGWKDSNDSVFHATGELATGPIAMSEIQGYVYEARLGAANLARVVGDFQLAARLGHAAEALRSRFNERFWCEDIACFAIALDGDKRPCRVVSSNAGHVLASGIAREDLAERTITTLMQSGSFNGWGIRTIAKGQARYNPMSYHNGSIWPHDNAIVAAGMARYGRKEAALAVMTGLFDASIVLDLHRLPELFCGFKRLPCQGPTLYPVACAPQAWAAGAVFQLLQSCLGLSFATDSPQLRFHHPQLPDYLHRLEIRNLRFPNGVIDLAFRRHEHDVGINVLRKEGDIEIAVIV